MTELNHITAGRTALRALLVAAVMTAGIAGSVGLAAAEPIDGKGDDPYPDGLLLSLDGKGNDVYPPPGVYATFDGKGNDVIDATENPAIAYAFPINNVSVLRSHAASTGHFTLPGTRTLPVDALVAVFWPQDMDPY